MNEELRDDLDQVAQYRCIVDDAWSWTNDFLITNSVYSVSARDKR